ncbi:MAG TPA: endolytic transglycosylase MltG [Candidatus Paceibacterota bacterium]|nr:endolytic transglycosylase MltG [Candidatus Paceibacterota bacterium]
MTDTPKRKRTLFSKILIGTIGSLILFLLGYSYLFGPMDKYATTTEFLVEPEMSSLAIAQTLKEQGFIRSEFAFEAAHLSSSNGRIIRPGGYKISKAMDTWTIADVLTKKPHLAWITVKPGMRKEQIADMLVDYLSWSPEERDEWLTVHTAPTPSFVEGVYYPDTYLIPSQLSPKEVADRMRTRFQEVFAPYANEAFLENKSWTDVINLASIVEREAAKNDKALVAAILWNRLAIDMPLQADATLQYVKGNAENGWWPVPKSEDKFLESPFNTYQYKGLPPHPIANPSLDSIHAVLNPESTNCIYYLHDSNGQIHCSTNYAGHKDNINRHLR